MEVEASSIPCLRIGDGFSGCHPGLGGVPEPGGLGDPEVGPTVDGTDIHYLIRLTELSNADKHRTIPLLTTFYDDPVGPPVWFPITEDAEVIDLRLYEKAAACQGKTELGRVGIRRTGPNPKVKMEEQFAFEVAVDHPYSANMTAVELMIWMQIHARGIIDLFSTRYP